MDSIETEIFLYSPENGGRLTPILGRTDPAFYKPHIVIGDPTQRAPICEQKDGRMNVGVECYLGVRFQSTDEYESLPTEKKIKVMMDLIYHGHVDYFEAQEGATFTIREGKRVIGYGTILSRIHQSMREQDVPLNG